LAVCADPGNGSREIGWYLTGKKEEAAKGAQRRGEKADILRRPITRLRDNEVPNLQRCQRFREITPRRFGGEKGPDQRQIYAERILREPTIATQVILVLLKKVGYG
jgi:hypothetical protein